MDKFAKGLITAGVIGGAALGASLIMNDPYARKRLETNAKALSKKAENLMDM